LRHRNALGKVLVVSELRGIVQAYMATDDRTEAWVAKEMGISRSALNGWWNRGRTSAPSSELLRALARVTRTPYRSVLDAALIDYGYLPGEGSEHGKRSAQKIDEESGLPATVGEPVHLDVVEELKPPREEGSAP
jgi:transcriptional regulator with XRE-family HTH domain